MYTYWNTYILKTTLRAANINIFQNPEKHSLTVDFPSSHRLMDHSYLMLISAEYLRIPYLYIIFLIFICLELIVLLMFTVDIQLRKCQ